MRIPTNPTTTSRAALAAEPLDNSPLPLASPWVDRHRIAKHYTVSVRTVDTWIAENRVPFRKVGSRVLFNLDMVEAALAVFDVIARRIA
jgi:excisionase family DNA binding protein